LREVLPADPMLGLAITPVILRITRRSRVTVRDRRVRRSG
jgi:hypothetical protein